MATSDYTPTLTTTFIFHTLPLWIKQPLWPLLWLNSRALIRFLTPLWITHPLWPPLPLSHMVTSDYTPTLTTTSTFTLRHFWLHTWPLQIKHPLWHLATSDYTPTLTTTSTFTHGHFRLHTHFDHHFHFHLWPLHIMHPLWPPLPLSLMATSDYVPTLATTSIFTLGRLRLHTVIFRISDLYYDLPIMIS